MRTTLRIDDHLLAEAKRYAAETGRTLTAVVEDALRERLARHRRGEAGRRALRLPTAPGGPRPGVDLDDTSRLLEVMEDRD